MKNEKENANNQVFKEHFHDQPPSFSVKGLYEDKVIKNDIIAKHLNESLTHLRNSIIKKEIPENENPNEIIDIVDKIMDFNKQQKGKRLKILTTKKMLQRLLTALAQVKTGNISEKRISKSVYRNIINSIKLQNRMDTVFMNSGNSKTSYPHRLLLNHLDKIDLTLTKLYTIVKKPI